ncbi:hypothetical protein K435DRAFT_875235 [Dendrothele bispora CBS 962.96]|uniref:Small ribosomal subunit protein uS15 N-terminal domain-containing protein n=1 Tax=Dendrothele bispora (strain CBS 962.96) TaxID=1314807 RepID=A0A4S8KUS1_DENBC|nr:hypothetical protein K435DRAFT_875235 [Dendrothele bispora CBS 962.96]
MGRMHAPGKGISSSALPYRRAPPAWLKTTPTKSSTKLSNLPARVSLPPKSDLWHLIKKAVAVRKHLEVNRKDKDSKFRLILIESRIHRLARYYKSKQQIPPTFKYDSATASTLIA